MVERFLLYPSHVASLARVRKGIFRTVAKLNARVCRAKEPISVEEAKKTGFETIKKGEVWATDFGCAVFEFVGTIPKTSAGAKVAALVDIQGEGLVIRDGVPVIGITQVSDGIDLVQSVKGKQEIPLCDCAVGGEDVRFFVDAGYNGKKKKTDTYAQFRRADIVETDEVARAFYYDALQLFMLLLTFGQNEYLTKERAKEVDKALSKAFRLYFAKKRDEARSLLKQVAQKRADYKAPVYTAIGHAHLDLAYLWPIRETKRKGARTFANQLANIKKYPGYVFGASQAQLFQWMKDLYPTIYDDVKKAVADGRIEIQGAMWTENDCNIPSGESIIRQFLYGEEFFANEFGKTSKVVWLPDVFGYPASLPQIFRGCGRDYFATIKLTWNNHNKFPYKTFRWKGIDGTEILSHMAPQGNYNSSATPMAFVKSFKGNPQSKDVGRAMRRSGIGDGGGGPGEAPLELLERELGQEGLAPVKFGGAGEFFDELAADKDAKIPVYEGELYLEKHQGTYTSQARNKLYNRLMEQELHTLEWLCALAELKGIKWDKAAIDEIWKEVLLYQFHDIIPGSSIKRVFDESVSRYKVLHDKVVGMRNRLLLSMKKKDDVKSVVNPVDFERKEYVRDGAKWYLANVAPYSAAELEECPEAKVGAGENWIANDKIRITFAKEGWIESVKEIATGKELCGGYFDKLVVYEDPKLYYNAWDIREDYRSLPSTTMTLAASRCYTDGPAAVREATFAYGASTLVQKITLKAGDSFVEFDNSADWHEDFKMLRAEFRPSVYSDKVNCDIQFGNVDRDTADETALQKAQFEICAHKFVNVDGEDGGFAVLSNCKYGYRVKDGYISLNLLRSPKRPDPECDRGEHYFGFAMYPHKGSWKDSDLVKKAYCYNYPLVICDFLPSIERLVDDGNENVIVETIKPSHDGKGIVARIYERFGEETQANMLAGFRYKAVYDADLLERRTGRLEGAKLNFGKYRIRTLYFEL